MLTNAYDTSENVECLQEHRAIACIYDMNFACHRIRSVQSHVELVIRDIQRILDVLKQMEGDKTTAADEQYAMGYSDACATL